MRRLISTAALIMAAAFVHIDGVSILPLAAQDRVAGVLAEAKKALGGADKVAALKGLIAEGPFRRSMGGRDMEGVMTLTIVRPDKMRRVEEISMGGMVGGPMMERTSVLAGTIAWDDMANRGGMGGGMQIVMRGPGEGPGPGGAPAMTEEQMNEARVRRARVQLHRWLAALATDGPAPWTDAGIAESPDGKADILETKEETGRVLRLFIDQQTHLPLMVQYQDPKPMVMINGGPGGPGGPGRGPGGPGRGPGGPPPGAGGAGHKSVTVCAFEDEVLKFPLPLAEQHHPSFIPRICRRHGNPQIKWFVAYMPAPCSFPPRVCVAYLARSKAGRMC